MVRSLTAILCGALLAACNRATPPVPVVASPAEIQRLAGEWVGEYGSPETGRSGSIVFTLDSAEDHAHGDVLMGPPNRNWSAFEDRTVEPPAPGAREAMPVLTIRFVRAAGDQVSGVLDPYDDPSCSCPVRTEFIGRLVGDTLSGTYQTIQVTGGRSTAGRWRVVRSSR